MTDISDTVSVVSLPEDNSLDPLIKVYEKQRLYGRYLGENISRYGFSWERTSAVSTDDFHILGKLAERMIEILEIDKREDNKYIGYGKEPNCHSTALFIMGFKDNAFSINSDEIFPKVYDYLNFQFSYEPQQPPVLVHLLRTKVHLNKIEFNHNILPHSVVYLGKNKGKDICFEKGKISSAKFHDLAKTEQQYETNYRLYAVPK